MDLAGYDYDKAYEHDLGLCDVGLAQDRELGDIYVGSIGVDIDRLTMAGHVLGSSGRDCQRLDRVIIMVTQNGGLVTVRVLAQTLPVLLTKRIRIS